VGPIVTETGTFSPSQVEWKLLTLFGNLDSGNVHKVQMVLCRVGKANRRVDVAQTRGEPRDEKFLAINPMAKVPAELLEGGRLMSESGAILYYFSQHTSLTSP
jgi:glutathione S-transferase